MLTSASLLLILECLCSDRVQIMIRLLGATSVALQVRFEASCLLRLNWVSGTVDLGLC